MTVTSIPDRLHPIPTWRDYCLTRMAIGPVLHTLHYADEALAYGVPEPEVRAALHNYLGTRRLALDVGREIAELDDEFAAMTEHVAEALARVAARA